MNADPEVMQHFPSPLTRAESDALADRISDHLATHDWGLWALEIPGVADFGGFVGLATVSFEAEFTPAIEVGWRLSRPMWGSGYATEAAVAVLACGFTALDLSEIVSFATLANSRSQAVMKRIGLSRRMEFDHPRLPPGNEHRRHVLYGIEKVQWLTVQSSLSDSPPGADWR